MADKAMNEFSSATSFNNLYAEDSNGNQNKVSKGNISKELWGYARTSVNTQDWNSLTTPGIYNVVNASGPNWPSKSYSYGFLEVNVSGDLIIQRYYPDAFGKSPAYRTRFGSTWRDWRYYSLT